MSHYRESPDPTFEPEATLPYNSIHLLDDLPDGLYGMCSRVDSSIHKLRQRNAIKEAWNHACAYCGSREDITVDHIRAKHCGGGNRDSNLLAACRRCNQSKGSEEVYMWYHAKPYFTEARWAVIAKWMND